MCLLLPRMFLMVNSIIVRFERPQFEALRLKKYSGKARLACNTIVEGDCKVQLKPKKIL